MDTTGIIMAAAVAGLSFFAGSFWTWKKVRQDLQAKSNHINHLLGWVQIILEDQGKSEYKTDFKRFHRIAVSNECNIGLSQDLSPDLQEISISVRVK